MKWSDIAQNILSAAGSNVNVERRIIAPGPAFSRDCRLLAVALLRPSLRPIDPNSPQCAMIPELHFEVVFVNDCVPTVDDHGAPPSAQAITDWSASFLDECENVHDGLLAEDPFGCVDGSVTIGQGEMRGPLGLTASMIVPITVQNLL
jgi:hypothetical protein